MPYALCPMHVGYLMLLRKAIDISHNYCGTGTRLVQNLLFRRCLLVICYFLTELWKRFPSEGRQARVNNNSIELVKCDRYLSA
jgi:hypothetical protein